MAFLWCVHQRNLSSFSYKATDPLGFLTSLTLTSFNNIDKDSYLLKALSSKKITVWVKVLTFELGREHDFLHSNCSQVSSALVVNSFVARPCAFPMCSAVLGARQASVCLHHLDLSPMPASLGSTLSADPHSLVWLSPLAGVLLLPQVGIPAAGCGNEAHSPSQQLDAGWNLGSGGDFS